MPPASGQAGLERQVTGTDPPAMPSDNAQALADLPDALGPLGGHLPHGLAETAILLCAFPQWAVWLPACRGVWTEVRPAGSMPPGPEAPMVRVQLRSLRAPESPGSADERAVASLL